MSNRIRSLILLTVILWQALSILSAVNALDLADRIEHRLSHWDNVIHDATQRTPWMGDATSTAQHFHVDGELNKVGLLLAPWTQSHAGMSIFPRTESTLFYLTIYLEGILRPPRLPLEPGLVR